MPKNCNGGYIMWSIKKYSICSVLTLFILILTVGTVSAASVIISHGSQSGLSSGDTFSVDIDVDSVDNILRSAEFSVAYDTSAMSVTDATYSGLMDPGSITIEDFADDGEISFSVADTTPATQAGTMLTVEFRVEDDVEDGTYSLDFREVRLIDENYNDLGGTATGSTVTIGTGADDSSTPADTIDLGSQVTSTSGFSSSSSGSTEQTDYSYIFGSGPDDYKVLDRYGQLQTEANWSQNVLVLAAQVEKEFEGEYLFWNGKITSLGTNSAGYLVVVFYEPLMVEGSEIEDIYGVIDGKAMEMGVENVPVEFGEGTISAISDDLQGLMTRAQVTGSEGIENLTNDQSSLYDPTVLDTAGKIPSIRNEKECWQWYFQDSYDISLGVSDEMNSYLQGGMLLSTGLSPDGYLEVNIDQGADIDREALMDEIYAIMNMEALDVGVSEVPVVFKLAAPDEEDTLASTSEEESVEMRDVESQTQETPGFGFAISLISISIVYFMVNRFEKCDNKK